MKKITLLLALCGVCGLLHSQQAGTFTIDARIKGMEKGDTIYIMHQGEDRDIDTIVCNKKNRISYSKPIDKMHPAVLFEIPQGGTINDVKDDKILPLCTGDYTLSLKGDKGHLENTTISGGVYDSHRDYFDSLKKYADERAPIRKRLDSLMKEKNIPLVLRSEHNALTRRTNDSVWAVIRKESLFQDRYVSSHSDDTFSAYILHYGCSSKAKKELYHSLSDAVKNTPLARAIKEDIDVDDSFNKGKENLRVGIPFTDFSLLSHTGDSIRLSSYKGKYVLLDFWGSWCGPCIKEIPHIKEIWKRYGTLEDFALIGMALETDEDKWRETIKEQSMEWTHVNINSEKDRKKAVNVIHGIYMYPSLILLDKEGHVIAIQLGGGEQNSVIDRKLEEVLK
ncbi:MAG: TlpA family protein disulfide reductase [Flavobacteriales bacterium]|nr:TlpA family protein disulfide reductase [Flavobacteriales bacterium]